MRKILVCKDGDLVIPKDIMLFFADFACINLFIRYEENLWGIKTLFYNGDTGQELNGDTVMRDNVHLIRAAERYLLGPENNNDVAIIEIPDKVKWEVKSDGYEEWVEEIHGKWTV